MDVINVLQPENHVSGRRLPPARMLRGFRQERARQDSVSPANPERDEPLSALASPRSVRYPALASFPIAFFFAAATLIALSPAIQRRVGYYRLGRLSFASDSSLEASLRFLAVPETLSGELSTEALPEVPASIRPVSFTSYKVRNGDTVSAILSRSGLKNLGTLISVNSIGNARALRQGQTLSIPSMDGLAYTVVRGDSLQLLANRYSVPVTALLDANDLSSSELSIGQKLFVPGASLSSTALRKALGELFARPIIGRLTSPFGYRSDPFTGVRTFHTGIDLAAPLGTAVKATLDGKVATTGFSTVYGNYVILTHPEGYQSLYAHLSSVGVKRGQRVTQSAVIGRVGNTGYSTGSHLHFSVYKNGKMIDPRSVLK